VLVDVGLDEQGRALRIDPAGEELGPLLEGLSGQGGRVPRQRQGVEVDDAVVGLVDVLLGDPVRERTEVIAEVSLAGGLDPTEDPLARITKVLVQG
jgi:hypothetical protein